MAVHATVRFGAAAEPSEDVWPVAVSGRKVVDGNGDVYPLKIMSSWGLAMRFSNADITTMLEGLAAQGFNAVNVAGCGGVNVQADWAAVKYENLAGNDFWSGTPFQSSLSTGFASTDHVQSECERLGITFIFSFFISYPADSGCGPEMDAATNAQCRTAGQNIAARYEGCPNMMWHVMADTGWSASDTRGRRLDYLFRGITETETTPRLVIAEPYLNGNAYGMFISQEGTDPTGYQWCHLSTNGLYSYEDNSVEEIDTIWNQSGATSYPVWDSEPPYAKATDKYGGNFRQQLRERNYSVFIRGYCGINYGDEDFWVGDRSGFYDGGETPTQTLTNTETTQCGYCWGIVDTYCTDPTWAPVSTFVTTGLGSGDTKAAQGASDTAALAYFPDNRTVAVDTTILSGSGNVRLRWFDPVLGTFSSIATSEAQQTGRSVTLPAARGDSTRDFVLVVDLA